MFNFWVKKFFNFVFVAFYFLLVFLFSSFSFAQAERVLDLQATDYVNDYTNTLTVDQKLELSTLLGNLEKQTGDQVAVFMINSMEGENGRPDYIEHFAVQLYEQLGLSTKDKQAGALFLISKNDRQMRIEVGYGLEATLTDGITKNILDNLVRPEFKNNDYYTGIKNGIESIISVLGGGTIPESVTNSDIFFWIFFFFIFGVNLLGWFFAIMARTKSWWLGGLVCFFLGAPVLYYFGFSPLKDFGLFVFTLGGFVFDYFISKNYKYWQAKIPANGTKWDEKHKPAWWAGGGWGPGGDFSGKGGSGFGGFGGGGFSGGGGSSSSW